jgi:hypothetical protein
VSFDNTYRLDVAVQDAVRVALCQRLQHGAHVRCHLGLRERPMLADIGIELPTPAVLHDDVDALVVLVDALQKGHGQGPAEELQDLDLPVNVRQMLFYLDRGDVGHVEALFDRLEGILLAGGALDDDRDEAKATLPDHDASALEVIIQRPLVASVVGHGSLLCGARVYSPVGRSRRRGGHPNEEERREEYGSASLERVVAITIPVTTTVPVSRVRPCPWRCALRAWRRRTTIDAGKQPFRTRVLCAL